MYRISTLVAASILFFNSTVHGQDRTDSDHNWDFQSVVTEVAKGALKRARRGIAVGPMLSTATGFEVDGSFEAQLGLGLGLYKFKVPILPSTDGIVDVFKRRAKNELKTRIKDTFLGREPSKLELKQLRQEIWEDLKKELLAQIRPSKFEKPDFSLSAGYNYSLKTEVSDVRVDAAIGIGPVLVKPGLMAIVSPNIVFVLPAELSVPLTYGVGTRTRVIDIFLRYEHVPFQQDKAEDRMFLGVRFLPFDLL